MAAIKAKNTKPELQIRRALHAQGYRYRLHVKSLPGKPDLVLPKFRAAVFINGCFWHKHPCHLFKLPTTRREFWEEKLARNVANDDNAKSALLNQGWRVATVWECALKGRTRRNFDGAMHELVDWIESQTEVIDIQGA